jgi:GH24 family phage-related lysozyme (muramidase)
MKPSVRAAFFGFTVSLEGFVPFMYLDILGLVTTAIGVLCNSKAEVRRMPWVRADGSPATQEEIDADFDRVRARQDLKMRGGMAFKNVAQLRLTTAGVEQVTLNKLALMESELIKRFGATEWESWPADAQLATLSMAWACGPWFMFPTLERALRQRDFKTAALACHIDTRGPDGIAGTLDDNRGVIPRNVANKVMYRNAYVVLQKGLDPESLYYPTELDPVPTAAYDPSTIVGYQKALALLGYDVGKADGIAGPRTIAAVKNFQKDHGLVVDGKVGPKTQHALLEELQKRKA